MNIKTIEKGMQILLGFIMLLSIAISIKALFKYNNLFDTTLLHAGINYQIYALIYIIQTILLCVIIALAIKLINNTHKNMIFTDNNYYIIISIGVLLFIYGILPKFYNLLNIGEKYSSKLNSESMSYTLIIVLGGIITILSTIYSKSQKIKEENDFTI
ncbi:DUF2975 domain-containing protein [Staphylococcus pasteuri]|uniref:DUF2975 domain-containing protein n=1 Tax=Staphylococcus pasteuri TaxID=45972 RepID=UPI003262A496